MLCKELQLSPIHVKGAKLEFLDRNGVLQGKSQEDGQCAAERPCTLLSQHSHLQQVDQQVIANSSDMPSLVQYETPYKFVCKCIGEPQPPKLG